MDVGITIGWGVVIAFFSGIILLTWLAIRKNRIQRAVHAHMVTELGEGSASDFFTASGNVFSISVINGRKPHKGRALMAMTQTAIALYPIKLPPEAVIRFAPADIRWFGRPEPYSNGDNRLWIHVERKREWVLVEVNLSRLQMMDLIRRLKAAVDPELVTAYRRRRPYMHFGPIEARPAEQDIHGAWSLDAAVSLYLMPRYLLVLHEDAVQSLIPLTSVQQISALRRLDAPQADGLVRFQTAEAPYAFSMQNYEAFANALAEAAKRTLEAPVMQKQKGKDGVWDDVDVD